MTKSLHLKETQKIFLNAPMHALLRLTAVVFLATAAGPALAGGKGILELDSKPGGAEVFVDGKKMGTTPETEGQKLTMDLPEGDHEIEIRKEGAGSAKKKVMVQDAVTRALTLAIAPEPLTNSLGMKFVPVPGTRILMCIHETRNKDYAAYAAANKGVDSQWQHPVFDWGDKGQITIEEDGEHPVIHVNWDDAKAFCKWLSAKEGKTYRLPTDHEWSCAVGIGDKEAERESPKQKAGVVEGFPWGAGYPPANNDVGNYWDATVVKKGLTGRTNLKNYADGHLLTAPVMKFQANTIGIYDLGGNVWEWCEDYFDPEAKSSRVLRGGSWRSDDRVHLASSCRSRYNPSFRYSYDYGFRCVLVDEH
jgi:hypothetical protein